MFLSSDECFFSLARTETIFESDRWPAVGGF